MLSKYSPFTTIFSSFMSNMCVELYTTFLRLSFHDLENLWYWYTLSVYLHKIVKIINILVEDKEKSTYWHILLTHTHTHRHTHTHVIPTCAIQTQGHEFKHIYIHGCCGVHAHERARTCMHTHRTHRRTVMMYPEAYKHRQRWVWLNAAATPLGKQILYQNLCF